MLTDPNAVNRQSFMDNVMDYGAQVILFRLPHLPAFNWLKAALMRLRGACVGRGVKLFPHIWIDRFRDLRMGHEVSIGTGVVMTTAGGIDIGDRCMIGHRAVLLSSHHVIPENREPMRFAGVRNEHIVIGKDVWIGAGVVVLGGVNIGEGAVIGANAVVNRNIPPFAVAAGVPARVLRFRG
jgi:acetyltransferase-like isoleucine patch superfamily enzyme